MKWRWCVPHDAQETAEHSGRCWKAAYVLQFAKCSLVDIEEDPVIEMDRIDSGAPVPEGWEVQVDTGAVQMISRTVGRRRALPVEMF